MGHDGRAGVRDGKDEDEGDEADVWCFRVQRKVTLTSELRRHLRAGC